MPTSVFFPEQKFNISIGSSVREFNFDAMILVTLNRYYQQLIFFEICNIPFNLKQKYIYRFSEFEIRSLGVQERFIKNKKIIAPFDFELSLYGKQFKGTTEINLKFKNFGNLEKSYYEIQIETCTDTPMAIEPFFLTERGFVSHITEFMQKMWFSVFCVLHNIKKSINIALHGFYIEELLAISFDKNSVLPNLPVVIKDPLKDVYNIITSLIFTYKRQDSYIEFSVDDVLYLRGLKKNKNAKGIEGGYKNHEREKINYFLSILNTSGELIIRETSRFNYIAKLPFAKKYITPKKLPTKLVKYSYKNELWEKRLGYYLCEKMPAKIKVSDLYNKTEELCSSFKPFQIRDKLENTMDNLASDRIILDWHYKKIDENKLQGKNRFSIWLNLEIVCRYYPPQKSQTGQKNVQ